MELHGVVCRQRNHQPLLEELQQWVLAVLQEQAVVAQRRHGNGELSQEVQVLQGRTLYWGTQGEIRVKRVSWCVFV